MRLRARAVGAILGAGLWIALSEFFRNQLLLAAIWRDHYASLDLAFPSAPANAAVWMLWSFAFATLLFCISRRFTLLQTSILGWIAGFLMMWLVIWNLDVLPLATVPLAVPMSALESFVASYICLKLSPPSAA